MELETLIPSSLAVLMATLAAHFHQRLPHAFWLAVLFTGLISMVFTPLVVLGLAPDTLQVAPPSDMPSTFKVTIHVLLGYGLIFGIVIAFFTGWLMRTSLPPHRH